MYKINTFKCDSCGMKEERFYDTKENQICTNCGTDMRISISAPHLKADLMSDKWAKMQTSRRTPKWKKTYPMGKR